MSDQTTSNQPEKMDKTSLDVQKAIETIKQPPAIDDAMRELSPQERRNNPSLSPEMLDDPSDLRDDMRRD